MSGFPETVSALEIIRALVALFGLCVSWSGRRVAREQRATIEDAPTSDPHIRRERELRDDRMLVYEQAQSAFCFVHVLLLGNALIQMAYPSTVSVESLQSLASNVTQVLIPLALARVSEHVKIQMRTAWRLLAVTGPREAP